MPVRIRSPRRAVRDALSTFTVLATSTLDENVDAVLDELTTQGFVVVPRRETIDVVWEGLEQGKIDARYARKLIGTIQEAHR